MTASEKQLPPTLNGKPWSAKTLKDVDADTMRKLIQLYGTKQINDALRKSQEKQ